MHFTALGENDVVLADAVIYSLGGGFIASEEEMKNPPADQRSVIYHFANTVDLMRHCELTGLSIASLVLANEATFRPEAETRAGLDVIWKAMQNCVKRGCATDGLLPGGKSGVTPSEMEVAFQQVRMPDLHELRDAFERALPRVRGILNRNGLIDT